MKDDYFQPDFYRFNEDSLILVKYIISLNLSPKSILDLGAGSGIIGIELARILRPRHLTLVEVQPAFTPYLETNTRQFLAEETTTQIRQVAFSEYCPEESFDLIVCNPPYYLPGRGQMPKNEQRAIARAFLKDDWSILLRLFQKALQPQGRGFIVLKNDERLFKEIESLLKNKLKIKRRELDQLMILELFTLNVDGN